MCLLSETGILEAASWAAWLGCTHREVGGSHTVLGSMGSNDTCAVAFQGKPLRRDALARLVQRCCLADPDCLSCSCGDCTLKDLRAGVLCPVDQDYVDFELGIFEAIDHRVAVNHLLGQRNAAGHEDALATHGHMPELRHGCPARKANGAP